MPAKIKSAPKMYLQYNRVMGGKPLPRSADHRIIPRSPRPPQKRLAHPQQTRPTHCTNFAHAPWEQGAGAHSCRDASAARRACSAPP